MILDAVPFEERWKKVPGYGRIAQILGKIVRQQFGADIFYDAATIPFGRTDLVDVFETANLMRKKGVIDEFNVATNLPDEPPLYQWYARLKDRPKNAGGGSSVIDDRSALLAALAEAQERHIWSFEDDFFAHPVRRTARVMANTCVSPLRFAGFTEKWRADNAKYSLAPDAEYVWIKGYSWTRKRDTWVPAQIVSGAYGTKVLHKNHPEPIIRRAITTGLATWPTYEGAVLAGALEVIERDAYMIMWLNQLSLPRVDLDTLARSNPSLQKLLDTLKRYRLRAHAIRLITDAPAYVICALIEDESGMAPRRTIGVRAHTRLSDAIERAIAEAIRARHRTRYALSKEEDVKIPSVASEVMHDDRLLYWAKGKDAALDFLIAGSLSPLRIEAWERDQDKEHLARIVEWCRKKEYEFVSVSLGTSKKNATPWSIEMAVIPELQPMHQLEKRPYTGGARLREIPQEHGYTPLSEPFLKEPHPFS